MREIVILSTQYWNDSWFRKHQFAVRFARDGHTVVYVEPTHSVARSSHVSGVGSNPMLTTRVRRESGGPYVLSPPRVLPFPSRPSIARANGKITLARVRRALSTLGVADPLLIAYDARLADALAPELATGRVVLDLVDDLTGYADSQAQRQRAERDIATLCRECARVVYTSPRLAEKFPAAHASAVIPNGFDSALFDPHAAPRSLAPAGRRCIGFVGTLFSFLDYELMARVADSFPDATVVLVGRPEVAGSVLDPLLERENVVHVGYVERTAVPSLVAGFDVCIAPFLAGAVSDSVSPLKIYEYLAMRKPVVCTWMAGFREDPAAAYVAFARDHGEFVSAVGRALSGEYAQPAELGAFIGRYSWDSLYADLRAVMGEELLGR